MIEKETCGTTHILPLHKRDLFHQQPKPKSFQVRGQFTMLELFFLSLCIILVHIKLPSLIKGDGFVLVESENYRFYSRTWQSSKKIKCSILCLWQAAPFLKMRHQWLSVSKWQKPMLLEKWLTFCTWFLDMIHTIFQISQNCTYQSFENVLL